MKLNKSAFTLAELLVALAVIGILIAILMPLIMNIMPNQKVMMAKRANYTIESVVSNLLNDSACYPDEDDRVGLANGWGYADCDLWGGNENPGTITTEGNPAEKFATLFKEQLQLVKDSFTSANGAWKFKTKDGMSWVIQHTSEPWQSANNNHPKTPGYITIAVDVNGDDVPNVGDSQYCTIMDNASNDASAKEHDVAMFYVYADGRVLPEGNWTTQAIDVNKKINSD